MADICTETNEMGTLVTKLIDGKAPEEHHKIDALTTRNVR